MSYCWDDISKVPQDFGPSAVIIGNFDGVHRGHVGIIRELLSVVEGLGGDLCSVALTFLPHPLQVLYPERAPKLLMDSGRKLDLLFLCGVDAVLQIPFTLDFAKLSPEGFVEQILVNVLNVKVVVVGEDIRFGYRNSGDLATMRRLGFEYGFDVVVVGSVGDLVGGESVERFSSTLVREYLGVGDVEAANNILGRCYEIVDVVVRGAGRGRVLGFPTANLGGGDYLVPADGVYSGWLSWGGERFPAAISVGSNPTFFGEFRRVEAHVLGFEDVAVEDFDLYGELVVLEFVSRVRGMESYEDVETLVVQISEDVVRVADILGVEY